MSFLADNVNVIITQEEYKTKIAVFDIKIDKKKGSEIAFQSQNGRNDRI